MIPNVNEKNLQHPHTTLLHIEIIYKSFHVKAKNNLNTLTANYEYSRTNRENLAVPIQMQLYEKRKTFCQFFIAYLESTLNFEHFEKR